MFDIEALVAGYYKDEKIRVDFTLVNPVKHKLAEDKLWFYFEFSGCEDILDMSQFNFYIMSKNDIVHEEVTRRDVQDKFYDDNNQLVSTGIKTLVAFEFKLEFLYYKTILGFRCKLYDEIVFIEDTVL